VLAQPADIYELLGVDPGAGEAAVEELLKELVRSGHFQIT
jgi:hypothetical protein